MFSVAKEKKVLFFPYDLFQLTNKTLPNILNLNNYWYK